MIVVSVGRGGQEIGDYNLDGLKEGLASGYFLPDDWAWYEGLTEWLPLSDIVTKLSAPPLLSHPVPPPVPPSLVAPPPVHIKQDLKPRKGKVTYVLKETKPKKSSRKATLRPPWRDDPATEKQIAFLGHLKAGPLPSNLTKGQAHDMIDARVSGHDFLTPKQLACLSYHGVDPLKLDYDEAKAILDRIHASPESFRVPEPWATAKYHLYPILYPAPAAKRSKGCITLVLVGFFCMGAIAIIIVRLILTLH